MKYKIITALDIGSSFVRSIIAKVDEQNQISIAGIGEAPSKGIEKGIVTDIHALSEAIKKSLGDAEILADTDAVNIFVNITGEHIKTHTGDGRISIPTLGPNEPGEIQVEHVEQVINDAKNSIKIQKGFERSKILHGLSQNFVIDGQDDIRNPVSMNGFHLIAKVNTIFADITPMRNLSKCIKLAGYEVDQENYILNHIALSHSALSTDEKRMGCILIDIGGGTCDISLYNRDILEKIFVVPMAGINITDDLAIGLKTTVSFAETIKTQFGVALPTSVDPVSEVEVEGISGRASTRKSQQLVSHVIHHRLEEILNLCYNKLKPYYTPELVTAGIVLSGGTANLQLIGEVVETAFNLNVKIAKCDLTDISGNTTRLSDPALCTALGLIKYACTLDRDFKESSSGKASIKNLKILEKLKKIYKDFLP